MHLSCSGSLKQLNLFEEEGQSTDDGKTDGSDED